MAKATTPTIGNTEGNHQMQKGFLSSHNAALAARVANTTGTETTSVTQAEPTSASGIGVVAAGGRARAAEVRAKFVQETATPPKITRRTAGAGDATAATPSTETPPAVNPVAEAPAAALRPDPGVPALLPMRPFSTKLITPPPMTDLSNPLRYDRIGIDELGRVWVPRSGVVMPAETEYVAAEPDWAWNWWENGRVPKRILYSTAEHWPTDRNELDPPPPVDGTDDPVQYAAYLQLAVLDGSGENYTLTCGGFWGPRHIDTLISKINAKRSTVPDAWPIVLLRPEKRENKKHHRIFWVMDYEPVGWALPDCTRLPL
jgi:hypothetical protein